MHSPDLSVVLSLHTSIWRILSNEGMIRSTVSFNDLYHLCYLPSTVMSRPSQSNTAAGILRARATVCWSDFFVIPLLFGAPGTLLLQYLFLLLLNLRINLGTFGRLVAVVLSLIDTRALASHAYSRHERSKVLRGKGTQRATYGQGGIFLGLSSLLGDLLWFALTLRDCQPR